MNFICFNVDNRFADIKDWMLWEIKLENNDDQLNVSLQILTIQIKTFIHQYNSNANTSVGIREHYHYYLYCHGNAQPAFSIVFLCSFVTKDQQLSQ